MFRARRANRVLRAVACAVLSAVNSQNSAGDSGTLQRKLVTRVGSLREAESERAGTTSDALQNLRNPRSIFVAAVFDRRFVDQRSTLQQTKL